MNPQLLHVYGPIAIQSYGALIALGVVVSLALITRDHRYTKLNLEKSLLDIISITILAAFAGGRILFALTERQQYDSLIDMILPWTGGLSLLGSIIGVLLVLPLYLKRLRIPILPFLDLIAIYAPLAQSFGRIGCFLAGCCYGSRTVAPWAIAYSNADCFAPLHQSLHPTQLYSALMLVCIFTIMFFVVQKKVHIKGQLLCGYLFLASLERFFVDFFRGDRQLLVDTAFITLSHTQLIALAISTVSVIGFVSAQRYSSSWQQPTTK